jgi:predicted nuclease of predicted toxin-antitoxin system
MRFKIDENLPDEFAEILREAGLDAVTVMEQGLKEEPDPRIIEVCQREERVLVTKGNARTRRYQ